MFKLLRTALIGRPMESSRLQQERYSTLKGLATLSSDALSSVAYAGEEILNVLWPVLGLTAFNLLNPISFAIIILIAIVVFSYRQTIDAYPKSSGGSYIVAKEHLGLNFGLIAGASLMFDYVLTVSVSVSAGVAAFTSAYAPAYPYRVGICLLVVAMIVILNLRGISDSSTIFSYPTYFFIAGMFLLIGVGFYKIFVVGIPVAVSAANPAPPPSLSSVALTWLLLRAFASGCTAMTGVEAVSNAVPNFKEPENKHARTVLMSLGILLFIMFGGLAVLTNTLHIVPNPEITVISQVADRIFGKGILYYLFQTSTFLILALAANTSFADFPMLSSLLAQDGFLPRQLSFRGDRLVFSNGIIILALIASLLLIIFGGDTTRLIPLYAVGVFTSFTLSQAGMVRRWFLHRGDNWQIKALVNGLGAVTTGIVTLVIAVTKFIYGAWVALIIVPAIVYTFKKINEHYTDIKVQLDFDNYSHKEALKHKIIIPAASLTNVVANTIDYAKDLSDDIQVVHISTNNEQTEKFRQKWNKWNPGVELQVIVSPYRSVLEPLTNYIKDIDQHKKEGEVVTVLVPEFITSKWWHRFLHNQTGLILNNLLVLQTDVIVTTVPLHLKKDRHKSITSVISLKNYTGTTESW